MTRNTEQKSIPPIEHQGIEEEEEIKENAAEASRMEEEEGVTSPQKELSEAPEHQEEGIQLSVEDEELMLMNMDHDGEEPGASKDEDKKPTKDSEEPKSCEDAPQEEEGTMKSDYTSCYLWVSNLNFHTKSKDLKPMFAKYGTVLKAKLILDYNSPNLKVCGFVKMASEEDANKAIIELPKLHPPPDDLHIKMIIDMEMIAKLESLKSSKEASSKAMSTKSKSLENFSEKDGSKGQEESEKETSEAPMDQSDSEDTEAPKGSPENGATDCCCLWVSNLHLKTKKEELKEMFANYGTVLKTKLMLDYSGDDVNMCGLVKMASEEDAQNAITEVPHSHPDVKIKMVTDKYLISKLESLKASKTSAASSSKRGFIPRKRSPPPSFHYDYIREKRRREYERFRREELREKARRIRYEKDQVMRMKLEVLDMERELIEEIERKKRSRYSAERRPYHRLQREWEPRRRSAYSSDYGRSSHYRKMRWPQAALSHSGTAVRERNTAAALPVTDLQNGKDGHRSLAPLVTPAPGTPPPPPLTALHR